MLGLDPVFDLDQHRTVVGRRLGATARARAAARPGVTSASSASETRTRRLRASSSTIAATDAPIAMRVPACVATTPQTTLPSARLAWLVTRLVATARARTHAGAALCVPADRLAKAP